MANQIRTSSSMSMSSSPLLRSSSLPSLSISTSIIITTFLLCSIASGIDSSHDPNSKCKWERVGGGGGAAVSDGSGNDQILSCELNNMNEFNRINLDRVKKLQIKCTNNLDNNNASANAGDGGNYNFLNIIHLRVIKCKLPNLNQLNFSAALQSLALDESIAPDPSSSTANKFPPETGAWAHGLRGLRAFELVRNSLRSVPKDLLSCHLPSVEQMVLRDNAIAELTAPTDACPASGGASRLRVLNLSRNRLTSIRSNEFARLTNLRRLQLEENLIRSLHDLSFWDLDKLEVVNISSNRLTQLPQNLFAMNRNLAEIHLGNNSLVKLTYDNLKNLNKLSVLDLSHNRLATSSFSDKLVFNDLTLLRILNLSHNLLTKLNESILSKLANLQIIYLEHNAIAEIGDGAFHANANLKVINLAHNRLKRLGDSVFAKVHQLNQLYLEMNSLSAIQARAFGNLFNLIELNLNGNELKQVPPVFESLKALKSLDLGKNQIREIAPAHFRGLTALLGLRLVDNFISKIRNDSFKYLPSLHVLNLASNQIDFIDPTTFAANNQRIHAIRLDNNSLTDMSVVFASLKSLIWLNISDNGIAAFDYSYIPASLEWLDLHANAVGRLSLAEADLDEEEEGGGVSRSSLRSKMGGWNLKYLDVSQNNVSQLNEFSLSDHLEVLNLNDNRVAEVAANTFQNKLHLEKVFLVRNRLRQLEKSAIRVSRLTRHQSPQLFLAENPLHCDCHLEYLQDINTHSNYMRVVDVGALQCTLNNRNDAIRYPLRALKPHEFLCNYENHCFQLCHCCDYVACDCKMLCPANCKCFYDNMWQTNIVNCARTLLNRSHSDASAGADAHLDLLKNIPMDATAIHLDGNNLFNLISHIFIGKKKLELLYLNHSQIYTISNKTFLGIQNLRVLHLDHNYLKHIHAGEFAQLANLERLHLQNNELLSIDADTFAPMKSLAFLNLRHNKLKYFHFMLQLSASAKQIRSLLQHKESYANNRWSCNCDVIAKFNLVESVAISAEGVGAGATINGDQLETTKSILKYFKCASLFDKCRQTRFRFGNVDFSDDDDYEGGGGGGGSGNNYLIEKQLIGGKYVQIIAAVLIGIIATALLITLICIFRINFNLWFYSRYRIKLFFTEPPQSVNRAYDAYLLYSFFDNDFVNRVLNYELEYQSFKTYLHYSHQRNGKATTGGGGSGGGRSLSQSQATLLHPQQAPPLPPANDMQTNMNLIDQSKRLIILITINFLQEELCNPNYRNYFKNIIFDGDNVGGGSSAGGGGNEMIIIIAAPLDVVMLEPIFNLLLKKKQNNIIFWGEKHFWLKLSYLMPQQRRYDKLPPGGGSPDYGAGEDSKRHLRNNLRVVANDMADAMMTDDVLVLGGSGGDSGVDGDDDGVRRNLNSKQKPYPNKDLLLQSKMQQQKLTAQSYLNEQTGHVYTTISDLQPSPFSSGSHHSNEANDENKKAYFV